MRTNLPLLTLALAAAAGCSDKTTDTSSAPETGSLDVALTIEGEYGVDAVAVTIQGEGERAGVRRSRNLNVEDPNATVTAREGGLPAGSYGIALSAMLTDNPLTVSDESDVRCEGQVEGVVVTAGASTDANLSLLCTIDGGQVQVAGALRVQADIAVEAVNQCPDLYSSAFVAPLDTSVNASIELGIATVPGASVAWSATRGTVDAEGGYYTCPDIPGEYTLTAAVTTEAGCSQSFTEVVRCHSAYEGSCEPLPSAFVWEGSCGLRSPCHLTSQVGCSWTASCRGQVISGEATSATSFPFAYSRGATQLDCTTDLVDGELTGTCIGDAGSCSLNSNQSPDPSPNCDHVLGLSSVVACGTSESACDVIQEGCIYQAQCEDGTIRTGSVNDADLTWDIDDRASTGERYRCEAPIVDGVASGSCARRDGSGPDSCSDFRAEARLLELGSCVESLPAQGFKLEGCGLDGAAFASQRGCVWEIVSQAGSFGGLATGQGSFEFVSPAGQSCAGSVVDGKFAGSCGSGAGACNFTSVDTAADESCFQLPRVITTRGCGFAVPTPFDVVQDGCNFYAYAPSREVLVGGSVTPTGIEFPGIAAGWECRADLNAEFGDQLWGECTLDNADGSVSQCFNFTDQGARLVIGL